MVKEVGNTLEESRTAALNTLIYDSRRQMCFATAAGSHKNQPPFRLSGKGSGGFISPAEQLLAGGIAAPALRYYVVKGEASQCAKVAVAPKAALTLFLYRFFDTATGNYPTEVGLPRRQARMHKPCPLANGTVRDW